MQRLTDNALHRPKGVMVVAALFAVAAVYLGVCGGVLLIAPGAISLMEGKYFLYGLELAGPWVFLMGSGVYGGIAAGLFWLQNWARWMAMAVIVASLVPLVPKISMAELGVPVLWYGLQIAVRVAAGWYLAQAPGVIDAFTKTRHGSARIFTDKT